METIVRTVLQGSRTPLLIACLGMLALAAGCSDGSDGPAAGSKPTPANPEVTGPISGGGGDDCCVINFGPLEVDLREQGYTPGTPFYSSLNDGIAVGYRETEYFIAGNATSYIAMEELTPEGFWSVQAADSAPFTSRIVVQRPENDADFNGTVVVEWFNVSGGIDAAPDWLQMQTELRREGYVWVGVSAQAAGIEGGGAFDLPLKLVDPVRYAELDHPGDSFSYDIFSQAAQAVRNPAGLDPLEGLRVERMIAVGQSQSASRLATYVNAVHPIVDVFDGFIVHSRGGGSSALSQAPQAELPTPRPTFLRTDLPEPVISLQTETDLFGLGSVASRQPDTATFRRWEVAGSAHSDVYTTIKGPMDTGDDPAIADVVSNKDARPPFIQCELPVNDGPGHWLAKAAVAALDNWIRTGEAATAAPWLRLNDAGDGFALDALGNVLGGIRTSYVDAPVAILSGEGQPNSSTFCRLFGTTMLLDEATLDMLYPTRESYIDAIDSATDSALEQGFLRPADADLIKMRARSAGPGLTAPRGGGNAATALPGGGMSIQFDRAR